MTMTLEQAKRIVLGSAVAAPSSRFDRGNGFQDSLPGDPTPTPSAGGGDTGGGDTGGRIQPGDSLYDPRFDTPPGFDPKTFGVNPNSTLPEGWVVNQRTGALIPPGSGPVSGAGIGVGELFGVGSTVYRWNGHTITKATIAESRAFSGPWIDETSANGPGDTSASGPGDTGGGGGGGGPAGADTSMTDYQQATTDRQAAADAYNQQQDALDREQQAKIDAQNAANAAATLAYNTRGQDEQVIQDAMQGRINIAEALARLADLRHQEQADPFKGSEFMSQLAGLAPSGNPLQSLISSGASIAPNYGTYDEAARMYREALKIYEAVPTYGNAQRARDAIEGPNSEAARIFLSQSDENLRRMFGGTAPATPPADRPYGFNSAGDARDFAAQTANASDADKAALAEMARRMNAGLPAYGVGGRMRTTGPAAIVDLSTGRPIALLGEKGDESLKITKHKRGQGTSKLAATAEMGRYASGGGLNFSTSDVAKMQASTGRRTGAAPVSRIAATADPNAGLRMLASSGLDTPEKVQQALAASRGDSRVQASSVGSETQAQKEAGLRALAGFQNPEQVQQVLAAPPAPTGGSIVQAIQQFGQTPLARAAMMLASHGLEGNPEGTATNPTSGAAGPYQIMLSQHPQINEAAARDPWRATEFMSNDYNLAAERVMRERPGLFESDPAQAAALTAFYAERPETMYDERRYRDLYGRLPAYAGGGTVDVGGWRRTPPTSGRWNQDPAATARWLHGMAPQLTQTASPTPSPDFGGGSPDPIDRPRGPFTPYPVQKNPYGSAYQAPTGGETEAHAALANIIRMRNAYGAGPSAGTTLADFIRYFNMLKGKGVSFSSGPPSPVLGSQIVTSSERGGVNPGGLAATAAPQPSAPAANTGSLAATTAPAPVRSSLANTAQTANAQTNTAAPDPMPTNTWQAPTNTPSTTMLNGHVMTLAEYVWIKTSQADYMPGATTEQKIAKATDTYNMDKYYIEGARQDAERAYQTALAAWQTRQQQPQQPQQPQTPTAPAMPTAADQAKALGKSLRAYSFSAPEMLSYLDRGLAPPPGTITDAFLAKLPPFLKGVLEEVIKAFGEVTGPGIPDYWAAQSQYKVPGMNLQVMSRSRR